MSHEKIDKRLLCKLASAGEKGLRDFPRLWPTSNRELAAIVTVLARRKHTYGTCVYAMALAAEAAYNLIAHKLGVTGCQAGCADLVILGRNRHMKHGFKIIDFGDLLYPQHKETFDRLRLSHDQFQHIRKAARALLDDTDSASPDVAAHWAFIAYGGHPFGISVDDPDKDADEPEAKGAKKTTAKARNRPRSKQACTT